MSESVAMREMVPISYSLICRFRSINQRNVTDKPVVSNALFLEGNINVDKSATPKGL